MRDFHATPYCVYAHYSQGELIYIGSGDLSRAYTLNGRSQLHLSLLMRGDTDCVILYRSECRESAYQVEKQMIKACLPPANVTFTRPKPSPVRTKWAPERLPMRCVETGQDFFSAAHAAEVLGVRPGPIHANITRHVADVDGLHFKFVGWDETTLNPDDKMKRSNRNGLPTRSKIVLDAIVQSIRCNSGVVTNSQLAAVGECTKANIALIVRSLIDNGYVAVSHDEKGHRYFRVGDTDVPKHSNHVKRQVKLRHQSRTVLDILTVAAQAGSPCPSNADIAAVTESGASQVSKIVGRLAKRGLIRVELCPTGRIITVDGMSTAPTANHNVRGAPTVRRVTRVPDRIIV